MRIILDACSVINLVNGGAFSLILTIPNASFHIGPMALGECGGENQAILLAEIAAARVELLDDDDIPAGTYLALSERFGLGDGETECLTFASHADYVVATDDRAARQAVVAIAGDTRLIGSLGLLRKAVQCGLCSAEAAYASYQTMKTLGGFMPNVTIDFFRGA